MEVVVGLLKMAGGSQGGVRKGTALGQLWWEHRRERGSSLRRGESGGTVGLGSGSLFLCPDRPSPRHPPFLVQCLSSSSPTSHCPLVAAMGCGDMVGVMWEIRVGSDVR